MMQGISFSLFAGMITLLFLSFGVPKNIQKKVEREIEKKFEITQFEMQAVEVSTSLNNTLPTEIDGDNLYKLTLGTIHLGYAFVDKAPSKTAQFDYLVLFDTNLQIIHTKVLIYREEYGGEIGSTRWLKQFLGMSGKDRVALDSNIDAISGATISVRSMTRSMDKLLQTVGILKAKNLL